MLVKFSNDKPIFIQLAEIIKGKIVSKNLKTDEKLPSVRELSLMYSVNPNTVQKALQLLEDDGLIVTDRTNGKFVSNNTKVIEGQKNKAIKSEINVFIEKMKSYGLKIEEIKEIINGVRE